MNNYNLDECYIPAVLKSIADDKIVATADTIYDVNINKYQSEINESFKQDLEHIDISEIEITNTTTLSDLLGIEDSSTITDDSIAPYINIYNPINNAFNKTCDTEVEYGTKVVGSGENLLCRFYKGSSAGLNTSNVYIKVSSQDNDSELLTQVSNKPEISADEYSATAINSFYSTLSKPVTIEILNNNKENSITTLENKEAVTKTTTTQLVANKLLTTSHTATVIETLEPVTEKIDYSEKTISAKLTFTSFLYMFLHRSNVKATLNSYGLMLGKTNYIERRKSNTSNWTTTSNTTSNQYYILLVPSSIVLSSAYTTFLGQNSTVEFEKLGQIDLCGATTGYTAKYNFYQTKQPLAFGDGSMTFTFQ